jgi:hypothetical protein
MVSATAVREHLDHGVEVAVDVMASSLQGLMNVPVTGVISWAPIVLFMTSGMS